MKTAIVLFNLGGPDGPDSVQRFRLNLFSDPAIIRAPGFIRFWLARWIAARGAKAAAANYALLGGRSPLLKLTQAQARALQSRLEDIGARCFVSMRYWHPFAAETVAEVKAYAPDRVLLLPLYPQFSTTTTGSSLRDWREQAAKAGLAATTTVLCCYFDDPGYVKSVAGLVRAAVAEARGKIGEAPLRLLFSAHGLPESIVRKGDPYQAQVAASARAVMAQLSDLDVDYGVCYQSRATPQKWISPSTAEAIAAAAAQKIAVVVVPIAFVSDHVETLVELDIENAGLARRLGVGYFRVSAPNADAGFIDALARLSRRALARGNGLCSHEGKRACEAGHAACPWTRHAA